MTTHFFYKKSAVKGAISQHIILDLIIKVLCDITLNIYLICRLFSEKNITFLLKRKSHVIENIF